MEKSIKNYNRNRLIAITVILSMILNSVLCTTAWATNPEVNSEVNSEDAVPEGEKETKNAGAVEISENIEVADIEDIPRSEEISEKEEHIDVEAGATSDGTYGVLSYRINENEVTITACDKEVTGAVTIPSTIGGKPVTSIGYEAFKNCKGLSSVNLNRSLKTIDGYAFYSCSNLTGEMIIPSSVTEIGGSAFYGCSKISSVEIPNSVTSIGTYAFANCIGIKTVKVNSLYIGTSEFKDCSGITSVEISNDVAEIYTGAFNGCTSIESIYIPGSVSTIGYEVFRGCSSLKTVNLNRGLKTIDGYAFYNCSKLKYVEVPASVIEIAGYAFSGCDSLYSAVVLGDPEYNTKASTINMYLGKDCGNNIPFNAENLYCALSQSEMSQYLGQTTAKNVYYNISLEEYYKRIGEMPIVTPSKTPTTAPSKMPTTTPSNAPTTAPSKTPTTTPTLVPTDAIKIGSTEYSIIYTPSVLYTATSHIEKGGKTSNSKIGDVEIHLYSPNGVLISPSRYKVNFKNNKNTYSVSGKQSYFTIMLKDKVNSKIKTTFKEAKFAFTIESRDLKELKIYPTFKSSNGAIKLSKVITYSPTGKKITLKPYKNGKGDYAIASEDGDSVTIKGRGNYTGTTVFMK